MKDNIFTVDEVAALLDLHPKTVRRYIREGKLKANKIGGQWRVMRDDLESFVGSEDIVNHKSPNGKIIKESFGILEKKYEKKTQVSAVIDYYVDHKEEAERISNSIIAVMNSKDPEYGEARFDFIYYENQKKARFILWGGLMFIGNLLILIAETSQ